MSEFYEDLIPDVIELLEELGQTMHLRRLVDPVVDEVASTVTSSPPLDIPVRGVILDYNDGMGGRLGSRQPGDGSVIQFGDRRVLLDPQVEPLDGDKVVEGGRVWSVVQASRVDPAGVPMLYVLQVRQ